MFSVFPITAVCLSLRWRIKGKIHITIVTIKRRHGVSEEVGYHVVFMPLGKSKLNI